MQPAAWAESQFVTPVPSTVHSTWFEPFPTTGQFGVLHAPAAQVRSHLQADAQLTVSHASAPEQVMLHFDCVLHVMSAHALPPVQLIVQVQPGGQFTLPQLPPLVHSARQVLSTSLQVVQSAGQFGTMQKPPLHMRPSGKPAQSVCVVHSNLSDARSTKHAANAAAPSTAPNLAVLIS